MLWLCLGVRSVEMLRCILYIVCCIANLYSSIACIACIALSKVGANGANGAYVDEVIKEG